MRPDSKYQNWWQAAWREREGLLKEKFGETSPPGVVTSFDWDDIDLRIPGACALHFPPDGSSRSQWLTMSHGLTQPIEPAVVDPDTVSGYGYEFGFLTAEKHAWCADALWQLLTYLKQSGSFIERGHRVPMWFSEGASGNLFPKLGKPESDERSPIGKIRALLFWPYMRHPAGFTTSTGYFSVLIGTTITQAEWELAKATSSAHLLLLLFRLGIGQTSDVSRDSAHVTADGKTQWRTIESLSEDEVNAMLLEFCQMH